MSDSDWAGVLSRWGNGVEDMNIQSSSSKTASSVTSREARHSSSTMSTSMTSRSGSGVLGSLNRDSEDGMEAGKRSGWGHQGLARSDSQAEIVRGSPNYS